MESRKEKRLKQKSKIRKRVRMLILICIISIIAYTIFEIQKENKIESRGENYTPKLISVVPKNLEENINLTQQATQEKVEIPEFYLDYPVTAQLNIPKINIETCVIGEYSTEAMDKCITKFWGPEPNEVGNFCITGHNYKIENMFENLKKLEIGDEIYLLDNKNGKLTYIVSDIYKVKPNNMSPISQETEGKKMITLITCTDYAKKRLIVQALEKE